MVTLVETKGVVTNSYVVELTQREVDLIATFAGSITGEGEVRHVSSGLFFTFSGIAGADRYGMFSVNPVAKTSYTFNKG